MEPLKSRSVLDQENVQIEWPDLMKNAQKNPHIPAKELQKRVTATYPAVHRTTIQRNLNNKDLHGRVARKKPFLRPQHKIKHLKSAK